MRRFPFVLLPIVLAAAAHAAEAPAAKPWKVDDAHGPEQVVRFATDEGTWLHLDVSPDGSRIVFSLLGDLYVLPVSGGEAKRITSGPSMDVQPRFSPDGRRIAFASDRGGLENLWIADTGIFPQCTGVNPMYTGMALARRSALALAERL